MVVVLEAVSGPITGRRIEIRAGTILRFGRTTRSDYAIGEDSYLSSLHFAVECDGVMCRVRDMGSSNGTFVNGSRVSEQIVKDGDSLAAGESAFAIHLEDVAPAQASAAQVDNTGATSSFASPGGPVLIRTANAPVAPPPPPTTGGIAWPGFSRGQTILLNALYPSPGPAGPVYAILDAARDTRIPAFLQASGEPHLPLDPSARVPVFVVALTPRGRLLDVLVKDGWSHGWGFFCASSFTIEEIGGHLRNYLTLYTGAGRPLTFRFWDPRVLRAL